MPRKTNGLRLNEVPVFLRRPILAQIAHRLPTVNGSQVRIVPDVMIAEKEYYTALERYLASRRLATVRETDKHVERSGEASGGECDLFGRYGYDRSVVDAQTTELQQYHLRHLLCNSWLFDHEAHARYSYYPSNLFPLGSKEEYTFFTRAWPRNVNYPYAGRLYARGGRFGAILKDVPAHECPCTFLTVFNVLNRDVWCSPDEDPDTDRRTQPLCRIVVENELLFKSDFFSRHRTNNTFENTNTWVYETFVRPYRYQTVSSTSVQRMSPFAETLVERDDDTTDDRRGVRNMNGIGAVGVSGGHRPAGVESIQQRNTVEDDDREDGQCLPDKVESTAVDTDTVQPSSPAVIRQRRMRRILNALYFGDGFRKESGQPYFDDCILARCEDHRSFLYSPLLHISSCKHEDEEVTFVQRRSGDEIATELRKCKACGRVIAK